jgi:hypothetical protein
MPWEKQVINLYGDTAPQFVMPEGWRGEYARYLKEMEQKNGENTRILEVIHCAPEATERMHMQV